MAFLKNVEVDSNANRPRGVWKVEGQKHEIESQCISGRWNTSAQPCL